MKHLSGRDAWLGADKLPTDDDLSGTLNGLVGSGTSNAAGGAMHWQDSAHAVLAPSGRDAQLRWQPGERLSHVIETACDAFPARPAIVTEAVTLSYAEFDQRANRLARHLLAEGVQPGDRVGLLFDKTAETYVAMLAVLKLHAAYVPLDAAFPQSRLNFISTDANLAAVLSMSALAGKLEGLPTKILLLDGAAGYIARQDAARLEPSELGSPADASDEAYIIYTSGTTGQPKGVIIAHDSICNFVRVASELYGYRPGDRVYQGMTIAFDFSVEEIWVPLVAGATLVPGRPGRNLLGEELGDFLHENAITCLACCPTLLSTIERELPDIRVLLLGGEACPQNLVERWHRKGRTILNSYGPTEATVTAMLTELVPDKAVTIGVPLPTYSIVVVDPEAGKAVAPGEEGEIGIAGIGLARGYLNNTELTGRKFIPDFLGLPANPSQRIYRTGDLGRLNADGEIEYLGRIDTQVKIRGYRIELSEIESVLLEFPQIAQAAVTTFEAEPGMPELAAYFVRMSDGGDLDRAEIARAMRTKLPGYMVPAYLEELDVLPMSVSNKTDYKRLPPPRGSRLSASSHTTKPATETERVLCDALSAVLKFDDISVEDDFFQDLGANSLLMARFCTKVREAPALAHISMQDIYLHPNARALAQHLEHRSTQGGTVLQQQPDPLHRPSSLSYWGCGALQMGFLAAYSLFTLWVVGAGFLWVQAAGDDVAGLLARSVVAVAAVFLILTAIPIAAKWFLVGRWEPESFPIWSLRYFRFWMLKTLIRTAPVTLFMGTPAYNIYLRLLGARIGANAVILSRYVPVCADLFSVGENTVLRKASVLLGYRAQANFIHTGRVDIGRDAFVGEASVLDINTKIGDGGQLGHASSLQSGQRVPDGKRYHGSPAVETTADYCPLEATPPCGRRRAIYTTAIACGYLVLAGPAAVLAALWAASAVGAGSAAVAGLSLDTFMTLLTGSLVVFFGGIAAGLVVVGLVPRICNAFLEEGRPYPLYGFHYFLQSTIAGTSNSRFYNLLFGDSSFIVPYLRYIGWRLGTVEQTGSNFGTNQRHDNPFLCSIGSGTMCSDGISMINVHLSSGTFCVKSSAIGDSSYLGNDIHVPPDSRLGANCLLGTKVLVPIDGQVRENVGLLGSPSFEIPRIVDRDRSLLASLDASTRKARLERKNLHNLATAAMFLFTRWLFVLAVFVAAHLSLAGYAELGVLAPFAAMTGLLILATAYFVLIERASLGFGRLRPSMITIYDADFWSHERHWKLSDSFLAGFLVGTPFRGLLLRLLGVKVGSKVYDGGAMITERTLTEIDGYANLNESCVLQAHSLEEGAFKSDVIQIGEGCSVGPAAFVHYGVRMGRQAVLDADSFLIKGETLDEGTGWRGNPAKLHRAPLIKVASVEGVKIQQLVARPRGAAALKNHGETARPSVAAARTAHA